jgi:hypothetical protein
MHALFACLQLGTQATRQQNLEMIPYALHGEIVKRNPNHKQDWGEYCKNQESELNRKDREEKAQRAQSAARPRGSLCVSLVPFAV